MVGLMMLAVLGILWLMARLDYVILAGVVWIGILGGGINERALLASFEMHTAIQIIIVGAALGVWHGFQQIRIKGIYVFKILACALSALLLGFMIYAAADMIWALTVGILIFAVTLTTRSRNSGLIR